MMKSMPMRIMLRSLFTTLVIVPMALSSPSCTWANDEDWPRWRGPDLDGSSKEANLLTEWPSEGPKLEWQVKGIGKGFSSLAVVDEDIYTLGENDGGKLFCLNRADGQIRWSASFGSGEPNGTPTVDGDFVYGIARNGELACVSRKDGEIVWQVSIQKDFGGSEPTWGYSESPLIDGDLLICSPGSQEAFVVALHKKTGKVVWKTQLGTDVQLRGHGGAGYSSPVISNGGGRKQYITLTGKGVVGVDAKTGELLWVYDRISNGTANIPTPIVHKDYVLCSSGYDDGGTALIQLAKNGNKIGWKEVYYFPSNKLQNHHGGMILRDGFVYMGHGHNNGFPVCFNLLTGKDAWRPGRGPGQESAAVAYADGHLYFRYQNGKMALIEATPKGYQLKGAFEIGVNNGPSWSHPVIAGGRLYLRDQDDLLVYDVRKK